MKILKALIIAVTAILPGTVHAEKLTIQIDWLPGGDKSFVYAALEQGYFEEEGLEVSIVSGRGSSDALTKLATGAAHFATGDLSALFIAAADQNIPVKAVYSVFTKQPSATLVLEDGGIDSIADMKGRTLGIAALSGSQAVFDYVLEQNGLNRDDIRIRQAEPALLAPLLVSGQVDAIGTWVSTAPIALELLEQHGKKGKVLPWADFGLDGYGLSLFTSDRMLNEQPEVVEQFVRAFAKGVIFAVENPEETIEDLKAHAPDVDADVALKQLLATIPLIDNEISREEGYGVFRSERLAAGWNVVAISQGYDQERIFPDDLVADGKIE